MRLYCRPNNDVLGNLNNRSHNDVLGDTNNREKNNCSCNRTESLLDSLCDEIGNRCNCQFAVGEEGDLEDRSGILDEVGGNFIVLRSAETGNRLFCNASNLQFISVFNTR
jgi:hypothetical protein